MILVRLLLQYAPCEALMPYSIRSYQHFPVQCPVTYNAGSFQGQSIAWSLSCNRQFER